MTASQCVLSSLALILKSKRAFHDLGAFITDAEVAQVLSCGR